MLYFVAPEWWRPLLRPNHLTFGQSGSITSDAITNWFGGMAWRPNYYITEDSTPAKLGSSLGWLLQLDGDNLRNAFLNAPWVKAVIPIRPGQEKAALNWLQHVEGTDGIGPNDLYSGPDTELDSQKKPLHGQPMLTVLRYLADQVAAKHLESMTTRDFTDPAEPGDPASTVTAIPLDRVYEHGFYPLQGSFQVTRGTDPGAPKPPTGNFEISSQWIEVLPTDQVVPVEVTYNPKTGRQL
jgi:hypothetical protein